MDVSTLESQIDTIHRLIEARLGIKGATLDSQARKIGRRLPRKTRKQIALLLDAKARATHPKLAPQINWPEVTFAAKQVISKLETFDLGTDRRRQRGHRLLAIAANVTMALVLVGAIFAMAN